MNAAEPIRVGALWVDVQTGRVTSTSGEEHCRISTLEARLLEHLSRRPGEFITEPELLVQVWGYHRSVRSRAPYFTFRRLVEKLSSPPHPPPLERHAEHGMRLLADSAGASVESIGGHSTDLVGRTKLYEELTASLAAGDSAVLVGRGGVGKTRLAREVVGTWQTQGRGAVLVDLAADNTLDAMVLRLSTTLQADGPASLSNLDELSRRLGRPLLVLDNVEQLADRAIGQVLTALGDQPVLLTSQRRLNLSGLRNWVVPHLEPADAISLFVNRARAARPDFQVDGSAGRALQELAESLEGLPLALELAAGRASLLTAVEIQDQLRARMALLRSRSADRPRRHQTLRATVEWSLGLLADETASAVRRLALLPGSFTIAHAQALLADGDALSVLDELTDRFLVRRVAGRHGLSWFALWTDVRQAALEQPPADETLAASRAAILGLGEDRVETTRATGSLRAHAHVVGDVDNLEWVHASGTPLERARAMRLLFHAYQEGGPLEPLVRRLEESRRLPAALPDWLDVEYDHCLGLAYALVGELDRAKTHLDRCIEGADTLGMIPTSLSATIGLTRVLWRSGDPAGAETAIDHICEVSESQGMQRTLAVGWNFRGTLFRHRGDLDRALPAMRRSLSIFESTRDTRSVALAHLGIGRVLLFAGDMSAARPHLEKAHETSASVSPRSQAEIELALAQLALEEDRPQVAESFLDGARASQQVYGLHRNSGEVDGWMGLTAAVRGDLLLAEKHLERAVHTSSWSAAADGPSQWWVARGLVARLDGRDPTAYLDEAQKRPCGPDPSTAAELIRGGEAEPVGPMSRLARRLMGA